MAKVNFGVIKREIVKQARSKIVSRVNKELDKRVERAKGELIRDIEENYPHLKEMLTTSKDYQDKKNPVVFALHTEVINKIHKVDVNSLLNSKKLFWKNFCGVSDVLSSKRLKTLDR